MKWSLDSPQWTLLVENPRRGHHMIYQIVMLGHIDTRIIGAGPLHIYGIQDVARVIDDMPRTSWLARCCMVALKGRVD